MPDEEGPTISPIFLKKKLLWKWGIHVFLAQ